MDHNLLLERLSYDPDSGIFVWKHRNNKSFNVHFAGKEAGYVTAHGYRCIRWNGKAVLAHRLAWFYVHGSWPIGIIDHIDMVRTNNAIRNLRDATAMENCANSRSRPSRSGIVGIHRSDNKWEVSVVRQNLRYRLGTYDGLAEAKAVLDKANADETWLLTQRYRTVKSKQTVAKRDIDHAALLTTIFYDPISGFFHPKRYGRSILSIRLGSVCGLYRRIKALGRRYSEHVLAIFYMTQRWPEGPVDHIDGNGLRNCYDNLRVVTAQLNAHNRRSKNDQNIGIRETRNKIKRWEACVSVNGERKHLGTFDTKEEARETWMAYRESLNLPLPHHLLSNTSISIFDDKLARTGHDLMPMTQMIFDYLQQTQPHTIFTAPDIARSLHLSAKSVRLQLHSLLHRGVLRQHSNHALTGRGGYPIVGWSLITEPHEASTFAPPTT